MEMLIFYLEQFSKALLELKEIASGELLDAEYFVDRLDRVLDLKVALDEALENVPTTVIELLNYVSK